MVKMVLGSSDAQGQTMSSVGKARVAAYNSAVTALSNFNGAGDLQGSAYDSGKNYGVSVITPLIKGAIMYSEYLSEAVPKLPSKYRSEVGGEDLDSAVLESEIQSLESSIGSLRGTLRAMEGSDHADRSTLQNISSRMDGLTSQKNEKMEKLRKLNLFAGSSNEVFSGEGAKSMDTVVKNLTAGLNMIHGDFASFGGTFPKHSGKTLNWAKSIEGEWDKKAKIDEDYQKVLEKANQGKELSDDDVKALEAYKKRYGRELPKVVESALEQYLFDKAIAEIFGDSGVEYNETGLFDVLSAISSNDWFKRVKQLTDLAPSKLTGAFLKSDGAWEILAYLENKGPKGAKIANKIFDTMVAWSEVPGKLGKWELGNFKIGKALSKGYKFFADGMEKVQKWSSPFKALVKSGLQKITGIKSFGDYITKGLGEGEKLTGLFGKGAKFFGKGAKLFGKAGTVFTFADLGITAISSGAEEYRKTGNLGKAAGKGALSAVASVGPLEGATIGATFGGVPGAFIGGFIGGGIQVIKAIDPKFFDNPVKETKKMIDGAGKALKNFGGAISKGIGGIGKALGFG